MRWRCWSLFVRVPFPQSMSTGPYLSHPTCPSRAHSDGTVDGCRVYMFKIRHVFLWKAHSCLSPNEPEGWAFVQSRSRHIYKGAYNLCSRGRTFFAHGATAVLRTMGSVVHADRCCVERKIILRRVSDDWVSCRLGFVAFIATHPSAGPRSLEFVCQ